MTESSVATDLFQVMPPLPDDQYALLKADIAARGVLVPVEYDEEGHILDGHHRVKACRELRIEWPSTIRYIPDMQARRQHARSLNLLRRQLTDDQRAQVMRDMRQDGMTIREIAKAAGVPKSTVHDALAESVRNRTNDQADDFEEEYGGDDSAPDDKIPQLDAIDLVILAKPDLSSRALAKDAGVSDKTVSARRQKLIATGQLAPVSESKGIDGKTYCPKWDSTGLMQPPPRAVQPFQLRHRERQRRLCQRGFNIVAPDVVKILDPAIVGIRIVANHPVTRAMPIQGVK